jgi:hypothetical protein
MPDNNNASESFVYFTISETSKILKVSRSMVDKIWRKGKLEKVKIGSSAYITERSILAYQREIFEMSVVKTNQVMR